MLKIDFYANVPQSILQELALYGEFTINETLRYFGRIYGMDSESIKTQADFLIDFLDLSKCNSFIRNMRLVCRICLAAP